MTGGRAANWANQMIPHDNQDHPHSTRHAVRAFTIVEIVVSIAVIAVLLGLLIPALGGTMRAARSFKCQNSLRTAAFDFSIFADEGLHGSRGNDEIELTGGAFRIETFQESQYGVDEFWRWGSAVTANLPDATGNDPLRCASVKQRLSLVKNTPCSQGAITPAAGISFGFNERLHLKEIVTPKGTSVAKQVTLKTQLLESEQVPLLWDVDGSLADGKGATPVFSAPSLASTGYFADDARWYPSLRHDGKMNVAFIGGHVMSTPKPLEEPTWQWGFEP